MPESNVLAMLGIPVSNFHTHSFLKENQTMRGFAYVIAVVAAIGIMIGIANVPTDDSSEVMAEAGTLVVAVPKMSCEFSCFPHVKETLEAAEAVQLVELASQKEEGTIDNRQVIVKFDAGFDVAAALAALSKEGFGDSQIVDSVQ
ncbi:MAG: heavy-metal-associated domain-containing protein [Rubripirellula sp.]